MYRAYGTLSIVWSLINGLKSVVTKCFKPTALKSEQRRGLGSSLAYNIVKAHGGVIRVEAKEGEGAEFIIQLPII